MEVHSLTRRQLEDYRSHLQAEEKSTATQEAYMRTALAFFADSAGAVTKASAAVYKRRLLARRLCGAHRQRQTGGAERPVRLFGLARMQAQNGAHPARRFPHGKT